MKKNFLAIAAVLIAAMLMVVSCTQEVTPKNGLVEASLNVAYGRDLTVNGKAENDNLVLRYTLENKWVDDTSEADTVVGAVANAELDPSGKLGYVTPGYWTVTVNAFDSTDTSYANPIFSGNASIYFNSKNNTATIYLAPVANDTYSIEFDFKMQDLGKTYGEDFEVRYTISKNGSALRDHNDKPFVKDTDVTSGSETDHQSTYKKTVSGLEAGYYTVTVSVYEKGDSDFELKGGISKGMLIAGTIKDGKVTISGHVEPSDYVATDIKTYFVDVKTSIDGSVTYDSQTTKKDNKAVVEVTLTDDTKVNSELTGISKAYLWTVDGKDDKQIIDPEGEVTRSVTYTVPGIKNISCRTIYSYKDTKGTDEVDDDVTYFWADTQNYRVVIDASKFAY